MISQIAESLGYEHALRDETPVSGKSKLDLQALIQHGMIANAGNCYSLLCSRHFMMYLPNPDKIGLQHEENWCYNDVVLDIGDEQEEDMFTGEQEQQGFRVEPQPHQTVPPHAGALGSTAAGSFSMPPDQ